MFCDNSKMGNRIRQLRNAIGLSQGDLGAKVGVEWQAVQRWESSGTIPAKRLPALADFFKVPPSALLDGGPTIPVLVRGFVEAGLWQEANEWPEEDWYAEYVKDDVDLRGITLRAAKTRGPSMNQRWPEGSIIVFNDMIETGEDPRSGKYYVVQRERADGLHEATVKKLWADPDGKLWLRPESDDPRYQELIPLDGTEGDTIRLVGRVVRAILKE